MLAVLVIASSLLLAPPGAPNAASRADAQLNADLILGSVQDLRGLLVQTPAGGSTTILELVYGLDSSLALFPAYMKVIQENGEILERDHRDLAVTIFASLDQIKGCYVTINGKKVWTEAIQFGASRAGVLSILGTKTRDASGDLIDTFVLPEKGAVVCTSQANWVCGTPSCSQTSGACDDADAPACPCNPGTGNCAAAQEWECRANAWCPPGQECVLNTSTNQCSCQS